MSPEASPPGTFGFSMHFVGTRVVVRFRGDLDAFTTAGFAPLLQTVVGQGHTDVQLDLTDCGFVDVSSMRVIVAAAESLERLGAELTIRSPSRAVRRTLELTGLDRLIGAVPEVPVLELAGPGGSSDDPRPPRTPFSGLPQLRPLAAVPAADDVIDGVLRLVVALSHAAVGSADGCSVSLRRSGRLSTVAASDQTVLDMDADQYATGEGPCVDASREGRRFHSESLAEETRWSDFVPLAQGLGINAILSSPLVVRERPIGALNIYSRRARAFSEDDQKLALAFAAEASLLLSDNGADRSDAEVGARVTSALRTRQVIALAQGVLMEREGVDEAAAYTALRRLAVQTRRPLREGAVEVMASSHPPLDDQGPDAYAPGR